MHMAGEEVSGGEAHAFILEGPEEGNVYRLPYLGKAAMENVLLSPYEQVLATTTDEHNAQ